MKPRKKRVTDRFNPIDTHVGKRIRVLRKHHGMSQTTLGEAVNLSFQQIQKYETGANRIGGSRLFEFSQVLDVPISYFFDDMPPELAGQSSTNSQGLDVFDASEAAEVVRMFSRVTGNGVRLRFRELAKSLARNDV